MLARRQLGLAAIGIMPAWLLGCAGSSGEPPKSATPAEPVVIKALTDLLPGAPLRWVVTASPSSLLGVDWLKPSLARVLRDDRLDLLSQATGLDPRALEEACLASVGPRDTTLYLARHHGDALRIERLFRQRLTSGEKRSVDNEQLVRVTGNIGRQPHAFIALGQTVVGFQYGGDVDRGPARIALLYAARKLARVPTVAQDGLLGPLLAELGQAPVRGLLPGPFDVELAKGARGLLAAATAVGAAMTPTERRSLALVVLIDGDYQSDPSRALGTMRSAWSDVAQSDLGHLLGLHEPRTEPTLSAAPGRLRLEVELAPETLFAGLAAATMDNIREIMR
jgi:hypothetical protein